jgi:hypothetical protein
VDDLGLLRWARPRFLRDFVAELNRMEDVGSSEDVNVVVQLVWRDATTTSVEPVVRGGR